MFPSLLSSYALNRFRMALLLTCPAQTQHRALGQRMPQFELRQNLYVLEAMSGPPFTCTDTAACYSGRKCA